MGDVADVAPPESVNWHVLDLCNYACKFCFFNSRAYRRLLSNTHPPTLGREDYSKIIRMLAEVGTSKLTFSGGEPTLLPLLPDLIREASDAGLVTMVVSNGTGITDSLLSKVEGHLSAVKLSVDSTSSVVEANLGRGRGDHVELVRQAARRCRRWGVLLMLNTVVTATNADEDLGPLIRELHPYRWKVFQVLPVAGQNSDHWSELGVDSARFREFVSRHASLRPVVEDNEAMLGSYVMLDPLGRFFQNWDGQHCFSRSVLEVGVMQALGEVGWDRDKFLARHGRYTLPVSIPNQPFKLSLVEGTSQEI